MSIGITVNSNRYEGFLEGNIESSLLSLSDKFILKGSNIFGGDDVRAGDECVIDVAGLQIITGYIDTLKVSTDGTTIIEGRDKTGDLVDSAPAGATTFIKQNIQSICRALCAPFEIDVSGDTGPTVAQFIVNVDESVGDAIQRIVSNYGMVATSDPDGNLVVNNGGGFSNPGIGLTEGLNLKSAEALFNDASRYSNYASYGQNFSNSSLQSSVAGSSKRTRKSAYILSGEVNQSDCKLSASRIKDFREGAACTVRAISQSMDYYPAGTLMTLSAPSMKIDDDMLIESVSLQFAKRSAEVIFSLVPPSKFGGNAIKCGFLK